MMLAQSEAVSSSLGIVAYLALFTSVGLIFLFVNLLVGRFVRPKDPHAEKSEIYECGEPTIGSSFVQFDLRFYVVALLFIIFDVEVAFFFPWATVYGKSMHLAEMEPKAVVVETDEGMEYSPAALGLYRELGVRDPQPTEIIPATLAAQVPAANLNSADKATEITKAGAKQLALVTLFDIVVFFGVLLVGFAYVWKRGDLDWVRAVSEQRALERGGPPNNSQLPGETVVSA